MGKHVGSSDGKPGTDHGNAFDKLNAECKGEEFDASHENPLGYAQRNFGSQQESEPTRRGRYS